MTAAAGATPAAAPDVSQGVSAAQPLDAPADWEAVVTADRSYFDSVVAAGGPDAATIEFPQYCPERRFRLSGREMRIGRRSLSRGLEPEIDLTGPPIDPGVSHLHAVLIAQPDGTWSVLDPGSSNGTQVNGDDIATGMPVPLADGDRVCVGAWTLLTIHRG
ncbi:MAG TPA: FHA domain-containing protein [Streptosporangiaceae bacterium]|nr:FHA domain-containing protein [Streptosporangiaceae bacterium]